jgi:hypothetical protein
MKGRKTGGRTAGTPNKKTLGRLATVQRALEEGVTPFDIMIEVMQLHYTKWKHPPEGQNPLETLKAAELAIQAARDAAPYCHAKLAAIEHKAEITTPTELTKMEFLRRVLFLAREVKEIEHKRVLTLEPVKRDEVA